MLLQIGDGLIEVGLEFLLTRTADHTRTRAIAAVGGTAVGHQEKDAVGVAVDESRHGHVGVLAAGIGHLLRGDTSLPDLGNDLPADRAGRIFRLDEVEVVGGDGEGQLVAGENDPGAFLRSEHKMLLESLKGGDAVAELPLPVVPLGGGRFLPKSGIRGAKVRLNARFGDPEIHRFQERSVGPGANLSTTPARKPPIMEG